MPPLLPAEAVRQLCPQCGLCCNGVLFGDVELQRGDNQKLLTQEGVTLFRKGRKTAFAQPCSLYVDGLCRIYENRPRRCTTFVCGLLKRVQTGETAPAAALKKIATAKRHVAQVTKLVRLLGNHDETAPLNQRYAAIMAQPIDLTAEEVEIKRRGALMRSVARLADSLERDFLT